MGVVTGQEQSAFAVTLARCAAVCEETLRAYAEEHPDAPSSSFGGTMLLASAALMTLAEMDRRDPRYDLSLMIVSTLTRETAEKIRRYGLDERLLRCALLCDRAADLCDAAPR